MQKYTISELDSGERVITERVPSVRSVALGFWIGAGSRDEKDERAGVSHFLEHLLFKGSAGYSAIEIAEIFDGLGASVNAATGKESTNLYARFLDTHLVLCYRNGAEWYDVHPLVRDLVLEQAARVRKAAVAP